VVESVGDAHGLGVAPNRADTSGVEEAKQADGIEAHTMRLINHPIELLVGPVGPRARPHCALEDVAQRHIGGVHGRLSTAVTTHAIRERAEPWCMPDERLPVVPSDTGGVVGTGPVRVQTTVTCHQRAAVVAPHP